MSNYRDRTWMMIFAYSNNNNKWVNLLFANYFVWIIISSFVKLEKIVTSMQTMCEVVKNNCIWTINDFLTEEECRNLILQARKQGFMHTNGDDITTSWNDTLLAQKV